VPFALLKLLTACWLVNDEPLFVLAPEVALEPVVCVVVLLPLLADALVESFAVFAAVFVAELVTELAVGVDAEFAVVLPTL
jgi:hypothetical protein